MTTQVRYTVITSYFATLLIVLLSIPGVTILDLRGDSMEPTFTAQDNPLCIKQPDMLYNEGDVVQIEDGAIIEGMAVMHRIVERNNNTVITKGDNNQRRDPAIKVSEINCEVNILN